MELRNGYKQTDLGLIPDSWEVNDIGDVVSITTGGRNTQDKADNGIYPFFVRSQIVERINSYSFDGEGVLTAGDGVGTGKVYHYIKGKFDFHQRVYLMYNFGEKINGYFFYLYFKNNFYNRIMQMTAKSSVDSVRRDMISKMKLPVPSIKEQTAIATALSDVDALIASLEKLISKKRLIKQGVMQRLLEPKEGWRTVPLTEVCWFQEGPGLRNWQFTKSGMKVINVTNLEDGSLNLDRTDRHISIDEFKRMYTHFEIQEHDIVVASSGNSYGKVAVVRKQDLPLLMNTSVIRFKPLSDKIDYNFLLVFLKSISFKRQIDLLITGGAQPNFGPAHLKKIHINLPRTIDEQSSISNQLVDLETEIAAFQSKFLKFSELKKGMMQTLLTGKIRLI